MSIGKLQMKAPNGMHDLTGVCDPHTLLPSPMICRRKRQWIVWCALWSYKIAKQLSEHAITTLTHHNNDPAPSIYKPPVRGSLPDDRSPFSSKNVCRIHSTHIMKKRWRKTLQIYFDVCEKRDNSRSRQICPSLGNHPQIGRYASEINLWIHNTVYMNICQTVAHCGVRSNCR